MQRLPVLTVPDLRLTFAAHRRNAPTRGVPKADRECARRMADVWTGALRRLKRPADG